MMAMEMADPCTFARRLGFLPDEAQGGCWTGAFTAAF